VYYVTLGTGAGGGVSGSDSEGGAYRSSGDVGLQLNGSVVSYFSSHRRVNNF